MRLFIAIRLTDEMKTAIAGTINELKKAGVRGRYVPPQNLHLTLAFIGEMDDPAPVEAALQSVTVRPFRLSLSEMGSFGNLLWIGLKGSRELYTATADVRTALDEAGIPYDRKKFVPHITILRKMTGTRDSVQAPKGEMTVRHISLMRSDVKDGKRIYTEVFSI